MSSKEISLLANTALGLTVTWSDLSGNKKKQKQNSQNLQPLISIPVIMNKKFRKFIVVITFLNQNDNYLMN